MNSKKNKIIHNQKGFMAADFLFSFVLVLSCGIIIFALTFSLATIEIAQYITWSGARAYSAANLSKTASETAGRKKMNNLAKNFPLLTGSATSPWFNLTDLKVGEATTVAAGINGVDYSNKAKTSPENRHPWTGTSANLELTLYKSIQIPFIGPIVNDETAFTIPIKSFLLRNPSQEECLKFFEQGQRFDQGIQKLESGWSNILDSGSYVGIEDNGC